MDKRHVVHVVLWGVRSCPAGRAGQVTKVTHGEYARLSWLVGWPDNVCATKVRRPETNAAQNTRCPCLDWPGIMWSNQSTNGFLEIWKMLAVQMNPAHMPFSIQPSSKMTWKQHLCNCWPAKMQPWSSYRTHEIAIKDEQLSMSRFFYQDGFHVFNSLIKCIFLTKTLIPINQLIHTWCFVGLEKIVCKCIITNY